MQIPSYRQLGIFSYSSSSKQRATTEESTQVHVKLSKRFSVPINNHSSEEIENLSDRLATKDTDSETKEHREDSETLSPLPVSGIFTSRANSLQSVPKSILRTPKYGMFARKAASIPTIQSFVDSGFADEDDSIYPISTSRVSTASRLESARPKNFTISKVALINGHSITKKTKKVTFAAQLEESEPSVTLSTSTRVISAQGTQRSFSFGKVSPIKPANNFFCTPSPHPSSKSPAKVLTFSPEELANIRSLAKQKNTIKEEAVPVPQPKAEPVKRIEASPRIELKSCSPSDSYGLKPQPPMTKLNLKTPLALTPTNNLKSCERFSEKIVSTPRIIVRQGPLSSRPDSSSAVRREFNRHLININLSLAKLNSTPSK